jgi:hypothetical protein
VGAAYAWAEAVAALYHQDPDAMLDKPLNWLRVTLRAAAERLGEAIGLSYADEERLDGLQTEFAP